MRVEAGPEAKLDVAEFGLEGGVVPEEAGPGTEITGAELAEAELTGAELTGAEMTGAELTGADLAELAGA